MKPTRRLKHTFGDFWERQPKTNSQKMKTLSIILAVIVLAAPTQALEGDKRIPMNTDEEVFQGMDADSSGFLSLEEYKNAMFENNYAKLFKRLDKDGDGKLSVSEFKSERIMTASESFRKLDTDNRGSVRVDEFTANSRNPEALAKTFQSHDADSDGQLSLAEFKADTRKGKKKK